MQSATGTLGVVSTTHEIASQTGAAILAQGGNAFDAAVAAGFVLQVVEPHQCGLGGEVVILAARARDDEPTVICGQGTIPAEATIANYRARGLKLVPGFGPLAAVVPGAYDAWLLLLRDYGKLSLEEVLSPAIACALNGFHVYDAFVGNLRKAERRFKECWPESAKLYLPGGQVPELGTLFRNATLAATYSKLVEAARGSPSDRFIQIERSRKAFYEGFVADAIDLFSSEAFRDDAGNFHTGVLKGADLAGWRASYERPIELQHNNFRLFKPGFWSQGPVMFQMLLLARSAGIDGMDPNSGQFAHTLVECAKLAFADREAWYGDCPRAGIDRAALLSEDYAAERFGLIRDTASPELVPGRLASDPPRMPQCESVTDDSPRARIADDGTRPRGGDTCHIAVIDREGNAVAATPSGGWCAGSPLIPSLGFSLSSRAQMCWLQEDLASSLVPGTRPRTTLSPTLAVRDDGARLVFGARGADMQDQWLLQFFLFYGEFQWSLADAVRGQPFHSEHWAQSTYPRRAFTNRVVLKSDASPEAALDLRQRGHSVKLIDGHEWFRVCAAVREGRMLSAAASLGGAASGH